MAVQVRQEMEKADHGGSEEDLQGRRSLPMVAATGPVAERKAEDGSGEDLQGRRSLPMVAATGPVAKRKSRVDRKGTCRAAGPYQW